MAGNIFRKYIWLVDTIYRAGHEGITQKEINERWVKSDLSDGLPIPRKTFNNHRIQIEEIFNINIDCHSGTYRYYIDFDEELEKKGLRSWLLNTFSISNLLNDCGDIRERILLESIPSGQQYLTAFIEAMRGNFTMEMTYQSFNRNEPSTYTIEPYCIKFFKQRWYVVAYSELAEETRTYAFDRIQSIKVNESHFKLPNDFDAGTYFVNSFGIIIEKDKKPEKVTINVYNEQEKYLDKLPLHPSQQRVAKEGDHYVYNYFVVPTFDFKQAILSYGSCLEVVTPKWFADWIADDVEAMHEFYSKR